jgi:hypothetical protein
VARSAVGASPGSGWPGPKSMTSGGGANWTRVSAGPSGAVSGSSLCAWWPQVFLRVGHSLVSRVRGRAARWRVQALACAPPISRWHNRMRREQNYSECATAQTVRRTPWKKSNGNGLGGLRFFGSCGCFIVGGPRARVQRARWVDERSGSGCGRFAGHGIGRWVRRSGCLGSRCGARPGSLVVGEAIGGRWSRLGPRRR